MDVVTTKAPTKKKQKKNNGIGPKESSARKFPLDEPVTAT